jgi:hypothetical protein
MLGFGNGTTILKTVLLQKWCNVQKQKPECQQAEIEIFETFCSVSSAEKTIPPRPLPPKRLFASQKCCYRYQARDSYIDFVGPRRHEHLKTTIFHEYSTRSEPYSVGPITQSDLHWYAGMLSPDNYLKREAFFDAVELTGVVTL